MASLGYLFIDTFLPKEPSGPPTFPRLLLWQAVLSDPGEADQCYPVTRWTMLSSGLLTPSTLSDLNLTGLNHFSQVAYGLPHLCLRLTQAVTSPRPRLDTGCGGSPLPRRHFQPLANERLVAHKKLF
jgi:hypothetical protein